MGPSRTNGGVGTESILVCCGTGIRRLVFGLVVYVYLMNHRLCVSITEGCTRKIKLLLWCVRSAALVTAYLMYLDETSEHSVETAMERVKQQVSISGTEQTVYSSTSKTVSNPFLTI